MKRIKYTFISLAIFLLLTGCGNTVDDKNNSSPSPTAESGVADDVGNAVKDTVDGAADGVKDLGEGVKDAADSVTK